MHVHVHIHVHCAFETVACLVRSLVPDPGKRRGELAGIFSQVSDVHVERTCVLASSGIHSCSSQTLRKVVN